MPQREHAQQGEEGISTEPGQYPGLDLAGEQPVHVSMETAQEGGHAAVEEIRLDVAGARIDGSIAADSAALQK